LSTRQAGFAQLFYKRLAFVDFFEAMITAGNGAHVGEARAKIIPQLATIEKFAETFAKSKSAAAVGAQSFEPENQNVDTEVVDEEREVGLPGHIQRDGSEV